MSKEIRISPEGIYPVVILNKTDVPPTVYIGKASGDIVYIPLNSDGSISWNDMTYHSYAHAFNPTTTPFSITQMTTNLQDDFAQPAPNYNEVRALLGATNIAAIAGHFFN